MVDLLNATELGVYFALRRAGDLVQRVVAEQLRGHGLSEVQFTVLAQLSAVPQGLGMSELAAAVVISKGGLTYQAKQLEARGLVERVPDPDDERAARLVVTDAGRDLVDAALPAHVELVRAVLIDRVGQQDLEILRASLDRVAAPSNP